MLYPRDTKKTCRGPVYNIHETGSRHPGDQNTSSTRQEEAIQELQAVMVQKGPLAINAAGDTVVRVNDEYLITMEKLDGSRQIMIGVTADTLTSEFPQIPTKEAHREIILKTPKHKGSRKAAHMRWSSAHGQPVSEPLKSHRKNDIVRIHIVAQI